METTDINQTIKDLIQAIPAKPTNISKDSLTFENCEGNSLTIYATNDSSYRLKYEKVYGDGWNKEIGLINYFDVADEVTMFMGRLKRSKKKYDQ